MTTINPPCIRNILETKKKKEGKTLYITGQVTDSAVVLHQVQNYMITPAVR